MTINSWGSDIPVPVPRGGTDRISLDADTVLLGDGTNPVEFLSIADQETIIGVTAAPPVSAPILGTPDQIEVTGATFSMADNPIWPGTGAITVPKGTTVNRPAVPVDGMFRYNTTLQSFEGRENGQWVQYGTRLGTPGWQLIGSLTSTATTIALGTGLLGGPFTCYRLLINSYITRASAAIVTLYFQGAQGGTPVTTAYASNVTRYVSSGTVTGGTATSNLPLITTSSNTQFRIFSSLQLTSWNTTNVTPTFQAETSLAQATSTTTAMMQWASSERAVTTPGFNSGQLVIEGTSLSASTSISVYGIITS